MKISDSYMMQSTQYVQRMNNSSLPFANAQLVGDSSDSGMKVEISDKGRRMGHMMETMGQMGGSKMEERMKEMKTSIEELGLSELDLDSLSDEEMTEVAKNIHSVMESFKPEHAEGLNIDFDSLSAEDIKSYVSEFKNNTSGVLESIGKMEGMMQGRPPMGGKPPMGDKNQNAIDAYKSNEVTTEEDEELLEMLEMFIQTLNTDENSDEDENVRALQQFVSDYLSMKA